MRRAAIAVVAVLLVMALGDLVFARVVERTAAGELERRTDAGDASVDVRSFPLVDSLVRRGEVREVTVRLEDVVSNGVPLTEVTLSAEDVRVDRTDAVQGDLRITRLGRADLVVEISEDDISEVFGVEVDLEIDRLTLSIDGTPSPLSAPIVEDGDLILEGELGRLTLPLPGPGVPPLRSRSGRARRSPRAAVHVRPSPERLRRDRHRLGANRRRARRCRTRRPQCRGPQRRPRTGSAGERRS